MVRKGSRSSISDSSSQGSNSTQGKLSARVDVENVDQGVLPLLEKLRATMDTVVARLGMLENAYFEYTRGPAGTGVVGSTGFQTPSSLMQSAVCAGGLSLDAARGVIVPSAHKPNVRADPSPQTVVDYADNPPCGDAPPVQLFKPGAAVDFDGDVLRLKDTVMRTSNSTAPKRRQVTTAPKRHRRVSLSSTMINLSFGSRPFSVGSSYGFGFKRIVGLRRWRTTTQFP